MQVWIYSLHLGHLEAKSNNRKKKRSACKNERGKTENPKYKGILPVKIITGPWQKGQG